MAAPEGQAWEVAEVFCREHPHESPEFGGAEGTVTRRMLNGWKLAKYLRGRATR